MKKIDEYINFCQPFIDSVQEVYKTMMGLSLQHHKPELTKVIKDYTALIEVGGDNPEGKSFSGLFLITWPEDCYLKSAGAMLGETYESYNDELEDFSGEIVNMVTGNAKKVLAQKGYQIKMATPISFRGQDLSILDKEKKRVTITTPFECDFGKLFLALNYLENE